MRAGKGARASGCAEPASAGLAAASSRSGSGRGAGCGAAAQPRPRAARPEAAGVRGGARAGASATAETGRHVCPDLLSQPLVSLSAVPGPRGRTPCFLDLRCDPGAGEEILAVGVLSSARNMEVYVGEEYCGTGRGQGARTVLEGRSVTPRRGPSAPFPGVGRFRLPDVVPVTRGGNLKVHRWQRRGRLAAS